MPSWVTIWAVDRDQARGDEIVGLAARAEARLREKTVQAHFADLLFGREFRVGRRFVVVLPRPRLIGFVAEFTVAVFLIPELTFTVGGLVAILAARLVAVAVLVAGFVAEFALAIGGLVTVLAARFVAVAVLIAGVYRRTYARRKPVCRRTGGAVCRRRGCS